MTTRAIGIAVAVAFGLGVGASPAIAQNTMPLATKDPLKCQTGASKAAAKFVTAKAKCGMKCLATQRKADTPDYSGCQPPGYTDPDTNFCIFDAAKGAEPKARASIGKGCDPALGKECPACFTDDSPSNCPNGEEIVNFAEGQVDLAGPEIFCLEAQGITPTKEQAKCEDGVAKALTKYVGAFGQAVAKCVTGEFNGKNPPGPGGCDFSGTPPTVPDLKTQEALDKVQAKAIASIDKLCVLVPGNPPCYPDGDGILDADNGQEWTDTIEAVLVSRVDNAYCGSPSGAFLD
jgi:hypothetical protein